MSFVHARSPPPRQLGARETLDTLGHWRNTFCTFYKRDVNYKQFVRETTTWDPSDGNYSQTAEGTVGLNPICHGGRWIPPPLKEKFKYSLMVNAKVPKVLDFS